jgi:tetrahydromethanopterin S-methyltransferase subunit G
MSQPADVFDAFKEDRGAEEPALHDTEDEEEDEDKLAELNRGATEHIDINEANSAVQELLDAHDVPTLIEAAKAGYSSEFPPGQTGEEQPEDEPFPDMPHESMSLSAENEALKAKLNQMDDRIDGIMAKMAEISRSSNVAQMSSTLSSIAERLTVMEQKVEDISIEVNMRATREQRDRQLAEAKRTQELSKGTSSDVRIDTPSSYTPRETTAAKAVLLPKPKW